MAFVLDTNVFIQGWMDRYPPDLFPDFWDGLAASIGAGDVRSSVEVKTELLRGAGKDDDVCAWAKQQDGLFVPIDEVQQLQLIEIQRLHQKWWNHPRRSAADPWVVALARSTGGSVVTLEGADRNNKIPAVCDSMAVECLRPSEMIRRLGWTFRRT